MRLNRRFLGAILFTVFLPGLSFLIAGPVTIYGQIPVATITGLVTDQTGAVIVGAEITVRQTGTGVKRRVTTPADGRFRIENLQPGEYELEANSQGFATVWRRLTLLIGDDATINFELEPGLLNQKVEVRGDISGVNTSDFGISGAVSRTQIENLPLNGRNYLELARLQPEVDVASVSNPGLGGNNYQRVSIAGGPVLDTRIFIDGSTVGDRYGGGTTQNFSLESVQEFQISTFSLDQATGTTGAGAINVVSRRGGNDLHGSAFLYYRDHHVSAYPGLARDPLIADPFFARRQSGFSLSGPVKRDRMSWFSNYEHNNQDGVFAITNNHPIFSKLDVIYKSPLNFDQFNLRLDGALTDQHQAFLRFSLDMNDTVAPGITVGMPSNWQSTRNRSFQIQGGVASTLTPHLVNDVRYSYSYLGNHLDPISAAQCPDRLACIGVEQPNILVFDAPQFLIGNQVNVPSPRWQRTYQLVDNMTWQRGDHRLRMGGQWEHVYLKVLWAFNEPAQIILWGPTNLQTPALNPLYDALPASLKDSGGRAPTLQEILQLPLRNFTTGIGNPLLPGSYNFDKASRNDRFRFYLTDSWQIRPHLTLSYGLAYSVENNLFPHDLDLPAYLAPLVGGELRTPRRDTNNFDPSFGLAWSVGKDRRTVIRGGGGIYHNESGIFWKARERAFIGPSGNARVIVDGALTGINFTSAPTSFRGQDLMPLLSAIRSQLAARLGDGSDLSVRGVDVVKQGDQIEDPNHTTAYAIHVNAGIQRELRPNLVLSVEYVMRRYVHLGALQGGQFLIDRNRFNRPKVTGVNPASGVVSFVRDPVIPLCTTAQAMALDPENQCSTGPINIFASGANQRYQGLHAILDKRFSGGFQFSAAYALSKNTGWVGFTNYDDYRQAYGYLPNDRRHRLILTGVWKMPEYKGASRLRRSMLNTWTISFISQALSAPPLDTILNGLDLDGDGISQTLLPGLTRRGSFGRALSITGLRELVAQYNAQVEAQTRRITNPDGSVTVIRPRTPFNQIINPLTLPDKFTNGDSLLTQDLRLMRSIKIRETARLSLIGEVFNLFNIANMTGYSGVLNQPNYGQPSSRIGQAFGTGGPRAFQFAARIEF
jgi:opacity protein-like surface antigen